MSLGAGGCQFEPKEKNETKGETEEKKVSAWLHTHKDTY